VRSAVSTRSLPGPSCRRAGTPRRRSRRCLADRPERRHRLPNVVDQPKNLAVIAKRVKIAGISGDLNNGPCHAISLGREPCSLRRRRQRQRTTKAISSAKARVTVAKTSIGIIVNLPPSPVAPPRCAPWSHSHKVFKRRMIGSLRPTRGSREDGAPGRPVARLATRESWASAPIPGTTSNAAPAPMRTGDPASSRRMSAEAPARRPVCFSGLENFKAGHGKRQRDGNCEHAERHQADYFTTHCSCVTIWPFGLIHLDGSMYSVDRPLIPL
jgi:hypothetical protein